MTIRARLLVAGHRVVLRGAAEVQRAAVARRLRRWRRARARLDHIQSRPGEHHLR